MHRSNRLLTLLVAASLAASLASCRSDEVSGAEESPAITVTSAPIVGLSDVDPHGKLVIYWHALTGKDEDALLALIDDFNASNEWGIVVVGEYHGDLETIYEAVMDGIETGQTPNLVMTNPGLAAAYAGRGAAVPLTPYLTHREWGFTATEENDFYAGALAVDQLPQLDNQLFSFPTCRSLQVLYFNADWLKELGLDAPPRTWTDFRDIACAASDPENGMYGFEFGMDGGLFSSLLSTRDVSLLNAGATAYTMGGERGRAGLQYLQKLISSGCAQWESEAGYKADFATGYVLFVIDSSDELPEYEHLVDDAGKFSWDITYLPHTTEKPRISSSGVSTLILPASPEEQLATWLFVKWLAEPEQQGRWAQQQGCFPLRRSALEEMTTYLEEHPRYSAAAQLLDEVWITEPNVTGYAECGTEIGRMLNAVTAGENLDQWFSRTLLKCNQVLADSAK
jgi:multiple sugar transport system substrate-binding protein